MTSSTPLSLLDLVQRKAIRLTKRSYLNIQSAVTRPSSGSCFTVPIPLLLLWTLFLGVCSVSSYTPNFWPSMTFSDLKQPSPSFYKEISHPSRSCFFQNCNAVEHTPFRSYRPITISLLLKITRKLILTWTFAIFPFYIVIWLWGLLLWLWITSSKKDEKTNSDPLHRRITNVR